MKKLMRFLCLVFFASALTACSDGPDKIAKTYFQEVISGNVDKAVELIYFPPEANSLDKAKVKGSLTMAADLAHEKIKEDGDVEISIGVIAYTNGDKTEATVQVILADKKDKGTQEIRLIKTDKGWRVKVM